MQRAPATKSVVRQHRFLKGLPEEGCRHRNDDPDCAHLQHASELGVAVGDVLAGARTGERCDAVPQFQEALVDADALSEALPCERVMQDSCGG